MVENSWVVKWSAFQTPFEIQTKNSGKTYPVFK
jgi:hypothetical protein